MLRRDLIKYFFLTLAFPSLTYASTQKKRVLIVGSGIMGSCIAYELAKVGVKVILVDKDSTLVGASQNSFNWINATYPKSPYSYNYLSQLSLTAYKNLRNEIDFPLQWSGSLEWFLEADDQKEMIKAVQSLLKYPTSSAHEIIDSRAANLYEPNIDFADNKNIVHSTADGIVNTEALISKLHSEIIKLGGSVFLGCNYLNSEYKSGKLIAANTSLGKFKVDELVISAGIDTNKILSNNFLKKPTPGIIVKSKPYKNVINSIIVGPGTHIHQLRNGVVVFGEQEGAPDNHFERLKGYPFKFPNNEFAYDHANRMLDASRSFVANLDKIEIDKVGIGWRPLPLDGLPIVGYLDNLPNTYIAVSHSGVSLGPLIGRLATEEILHQTSNKLLNDFRPQRF